MAAAFAPRCPGVVDRQGAKSRFVKIDLLGSIRAIPSTKAGCPQAQCTGRASVSPICERGWRSLGWVVMARLRSRRPRNTGQRDCAKRKIGSEGPIIERETFRIRARLQTGTIPIRYVETKTGQSLCETRSRSPMHLNFPAARSKSATQEAGQLFRDG